MKKKTGDIIFALIIGALLVGVPLFCYAGGTQTVTVRAVIPTSSSLNLSVSRVTGTTWANATSIDFGTLTYNSTLGIFLPTSYYAVDCGVVDNTGNAWTLTHARTNVANGNATLNNNINVDFIRQLSSNTSVLTPLAELSYANATGSAATFTKAQILGTNSTGWLRIYYGIGTGNTTDNPGVRPINATQPGGTYTGSVTLTLAP